jgi:hypothetical protein
VTVAKLCSVVEHAITVFRDNSIQFRKAELLPDAALCEVTARALETALRHVYASPVEAVQTDPSSSPHYLEQLREALSIGSGASRTRGAFASADLVNWLVEALLEGHEHVLALREPAELFATDLETVVQADRWIAKVEGGPPVTRPPPESDP